MATILQYVAYLGLRLIEGVMRLMPLRLCCSLGTLGGRIFGWLAPGYRRLVFDNLTLAFGDELGEAQRKALARRHFASLGRNFVASLKVATMPTEAVEARVSYEGHEHLLEAGANGRGVIGAIGHFGNWELLSQVPSLFSRPERATMFRSLDNRFINDYVVRSRSRIGLTLFDRTDGIAGPLKFIRDGGGVGVLFDQHAGHAGVWCPLFGRLASTTKLPALLAIKTKVAIVPMAVRSDGPGRWKIVCLPAIEPDEPVPEGLNRSSHLTARLNRALEDLVRIAPEEWFWVHDRWKTPLPNFLLGTRKRDVHALETDGEPSQLKPFRLLVRSPNPLGDACMAIPALRAMKRGARPDLELTVLCRANLRAVWERVAEVDRVLCIEPDASKPRAVSRLIRATAHFDAAVLLPNSLSSALECKLAGIPRIVGARGHHRRWLLNQVVPAAQVAGPPRHHAHFYLDIAAHCGADISAVDPFAAKAAAIANTTDSEPRSGHVIGLCPGAEYGEAKRWPVDRYAEAVLEVQGRLNGDAGSCEWRIFGSPNETGLAAELADSIAVVAPENRAGKTTIDQLADELAGCDVVLTNDTGTMHLAGALGVPTVGIFGSTEPAWTAPLGKGHRVIRRHVECSPCFLRECPRDYRCMNEIETSIVVDALLDQLNGAGA